MPRGGQTNPNSKRAQIQTYLAHNPTAVYKDVAKAFEVLPSYVSQIASKMELPSRKVNIDRSHRQQEAARRHIKPETLDNRLLETIYRDRLVNAILDTGE